MRWAATRQALSSQQHARVSLVNIALHKRPHAYCAQLCEVLAHPDLPLPHVHAHDDLPAIRLLLAVQGAASHHHLRAREQRERRAGSLRGADGRRSPRC